MPDPKEITDPNQIGAEQQHRGESAPAAPGAPAGANAEAARTAALPLPADALIILPMRNMVLFPGMVMPLAIGRERSIAAAQEAVREQRPLGLLLQHDAETVEPGPGDLHQIGTTARILRYLTTPDGGHNIICQGEQRFRVIEFLP